jgi:preprotein translocase subunit SecA
VVLSKVLRLGEGKALRKCEAIVGPTNALEDEMRQLTDAELRGLTDVYRQRLADGEDLDDLIPEAFATVREAARRIRGQRHFDVQLVGGAALHFGKIAEMRTGEGKTLTATLPCYLNALTGDGVHVVTVNDYLAKRDADNMGVVHRFLGLDVGVILATMTPWERKPNYDADITYGTNNEFGFDYLRDNMALTVDELVQRGHAYAIVDEVDSILIDEARTPLIISGPAEQGARWYQTFARIAPRLIADVHYEVDEGKHTVAINEEGIAKVEEILGIENLYDSLNTPLVHHLQNAVRAKELYKRDDEYIVRDGEVLIVDEFTGRVLEGRRYSEGLHQAIEAKEGVKIKEENQTYATVTLQNYFRMYDKLAGMTGTGKTEAAEFEHTYKLGVIEIPTNRPMIRIDHADVIYKTEEAKYAALIDEILERHDRGQPVLIGTTSIDKSERISRLLEKRGVKHGTKAGVDHTVLNAKHHEREAHIIAQAGRRGAITVATNMAGRGVDIMLGGNVEYLAEESLRARGMDPNETEPEVWSQTYAAELAEKVSQVETEHDEVADLGGLAVIGTERHESRRIDNQLRGRSGRQGDPGDSKFFLSLEDDLLRMFATRTVSGLMDRLNLPEDTPISHKMVTRAIKNAQRQVEAQNFERRKNVVKYDEVLNKQRQVIYEVRRRILEGEGLSEQMYGFLEDTVMSLVREHTPEEIYPEEWDLDGLFAALSTTIPTDLTAESVDLEVMNHVELEALLLEEARQAWKVRSDELGPDLLGELCRAVMLTVLDRRWREHLYEMDSLQEGIGLRAIGQRDPLVEYQREGFDMFQHMQETIKAESVAYVFNASVQVAEEAEEQRRAAPREQVRLSSASTEEEETAVVQTRRSKHEKPGRNQPCHCGSGKKYKLCHGRPGVDAGV